jgi:hypothetical protein
LQVLRALRILVHHSPSCLSGGALLALSLSMWSVLDQPSALDVQIAAAELLAVVLLVFQESYVEQLQKDPSFNADLHNDTLDVFCNPDVLNLLREALPSKADKDSVSRTVTALDNVLAKHLAAETAQGILDHVR